MAAAFPPVSQWMSPLQGAELAVLAAGLLAALAAPAGAGRAARRLLGAMDAAGRRPGAAIALAGVIAFAGAALSGLGGRLREPTVHDEFSYLLAADTFARGRLTNPTPQPGAAFETFHVLTEPTYQSKYPPGQGLVLAAGKVAAGDPVVGVWLSASLACAAIAWALFAWLPPRWAVTGTVIAVARFGIAGYWAQSFWGGALAALGGALVLGAVGRLRSGPRVASALALGAGLGILSLTRPFEGLVASLPAAAFLAWKLRSPGRLGGGAWVLRVVAPTLAVTAIALGFLARYNRAVTGSALRLPYFVYHQENSRISPWMWGTPPPAPAQRDAVIRAFFEDEADTRARQTASAGALAGAIAFKLWSAVDFPFAPSFAALLLLCGRALVRSRASGFAAVTFLLVLAAIAQETVALPHYAAPVAACGFLLVAQALRALNARRAGGTGAVAVAVVLVVAVGRLGVRLFEDADRSDAFGHLRASTEQRLIDSVGEDIVFVRYGPGHLPHLEWVWNGAEPASQPVLWARSRGSGEDRALRDLHAGRRAWLLYVDAGDQEPQLTEYSP